MGELYDAGDGCGRIGRLHVEVGPCLGAAGFDVAALYGSGQVEVEFGSAARRADRDLAYVRVPRKLREQSKTDRQRGVAERRRPLVVAANGGWLIGVHDVSAVAPAL